MRIKFIHTYEDIISLENLLEAWEEFISGKRQRKDVQEFQQKLIENIISLHTDLTHKKYKHSSYKAFTISDPKPRSIHKSAVRDRLLHHATCRILYPFFDKTFIFDSYSCRLGKGTNKAMDRFRSFAHKASKNNTKTCWVLKCDIKKFFASIDQKVLIDILKMYIPDQDILWLLSQIIGSFNSGISGIGLPLGNLTSQLLVNIYMNEFDQFAKHGLRVKYYIRYADDFVFLSKNRGWLEELIPRADSFLTERLKLMLHPGKLFIKTIASGADFLGWVHFPDHRVLRTTTKKRMLRGIASKLGNEATVQSYLGLLSHGNTAKLRQKISIRHG